MKKLTISIKSSSQVMESYKKAFKRAKEGKIIEPIYEVSFDSRKGFEKFTRNIYILTSIRTLKPKSVYELAKLLNMDVSNLNKIIIYFEEIGAIQTREKTINGRTVKTPEVLYDKIEFDLKAA